MRCTVIWDPAATDQLADIWVLATDQQAVADATDEIDRLLRFFADTIGEDHGDHRRLAVEPLEVVFNIFPDDCLVIVRQVMRVN